MISLHSAMGGCVGATMGGPLVKTRTPTCNEVANVKFCCSGHHMCCGINVQAIHDASCRFAAVSAVAPGGTNDATAIKETTLPWKINNLPWTRFVVGDNACTCTANTSPHLSRAQTRMITQETVSVIISVSAGLESNAALANKPTATTTTTTTTTCFCCKCKQISQN